MAGHACCLLKECGALNNHTERWYFFENGKRKGPVSRESLVAVVRYGALAPSAEVLRVGDSVPVPLMDTPFAEYLRDAEANRGGRSRISEPSMSVIDDVRQFFRRPRQFLLKKLSERSLRRQREVWRKYYGPFDESDCSASNLPIQGSEVGCLPGEFVVWLRELDPAPRSFLFAGDSRSAAAQMAEALGARTHATTGILDVDYPWDFNDPLPEGVPCFDAVISLSMLEHILAPFSHVRHLATRLNPGGHIMIYTCAPGFDYHRYPIDTLRFHIDWFEEAAIKLGLKLVRKRLAGYGLYVLLRRDQDTGL